MFDKKKRKKLILLKIQVIYSLPKTSGYYSVCCGAIVLNICHDTEHQEVAEPHISVKISKLNSFEVTSKLLIGKMSK